MAPSTVPARQVVNQMSIGRPATRFAASRITAPASHSAVPTATTVLIRLSRGGNGGGSVTAAAYDPRPIYGVHVAELDERQQGSGVTERLFRISERGSTVSRELRGGLVTFVTMSHIIVLSSSC
jgi:hypothetical protein